MVLPDFLVVTTIADSLCLLDIDLLDPLSEDFHECIALFQVVCSERQAAVKSGSQTCSWLLSRAHILSVI